jgi:hypothetical protein
VQWLGNWSQRDPDPEDGGGHSAEWGPKPRQPKEPPHSQKQERTQVVRENNLTSRVLGVQVPNPGSFSPGTAGRPRQSYDNLPKDLGHLGRGRQIGFTLQPFGDFGTPPRGLSGSRPGGNAPPGIYGSMPRRSRAVALGGGTTCRHNMYVCGVRVCVRVCACMRACVRACMHAAMFVCVVHALYACYVHMHMHVFVCACT